MFKKPSSLKTVSELTIMKQCIFSLVTLLNILKQINKSDGEYIDADKLLSICQDWEYFLCTFINH
jgi:hypothetical protein